MRNRLRRAGFILFLLLLLPGAGMAQDMPTAGEDAPAIDGSFGDAPAVGEGDPSIGESGGSIDSPELGEGDPTIGETGDSPDVEDPFD